jgi:hypothetical protein
VAAKGAESERSGILETLCEVDKSVCCCTCGCRAREGATVGGVIDVPSCCALVLRLLTDARIADRSLPSRRRENVACALVWEACWRCHINSRVPPKSRWRASCFFLRDLCRLWPSATSYEHSIDKSSQVEHVGRTPSHCRALLDTIDAVAKGQTRPVLLLRTWPTCNLDLSSWCCMRERRMSLNVW